MTGGKKLGRRAFLSASTLSAISFCTGSALAAPAVGGKAAASSARTLSFVNVNTGESGRIRYWEQGNYIPEALAEIDKALRDRRTGEVHAISPDLVDLVVRLGSRLQTSAPVHVISAYRSPQSNSQMAAASRGVARLSYHCRGMAIDVRVPGRTLSQLRSAALQLAGGGVGSYPRSDFIHLDVGPVRRW